MPKKRSQLLSMQMMTQIALFATIAFILSFFRVSLPIFPGFLQFDLVDVPIIVGALLFGPIAGILILVVNLLLYLAIVGSRTYGIGSLVNFLLGSSYVLALCFVHNRVKGFKGLVAGATVASLAATLMAATVNYTFVIRAFASFFGGMQTIINMTSAIHPAINSLESIVLFSIIPFNLMKFLVASTAAIVLYKAIVKTIPAITSLRNRTLKKSE